MRLVSLCVVGVAYVAAATFTRAGDSAPAPFCSIDPLGVFDFSDSYFTGVATSDSLAGGSVRRYYRPETRDSGALQPANGQVVTVRRLTRRASSEFRDALKESGDRALLVPWSYGPDCRPMRWDGPALWMSPGEGGLFSGTLRPRASWVNNLPTLDVTPYLTPYPLVSAFGRSLANGQSLSADELMSFYDALPKLSLPNGNTDNAARERSEYRDALLAWAAENPDLAARPPVSERVAGIRVTIALAPYANRNSPLAGTWRFVIRVPGLDSAVVFGRTRSSGGNGFIPKAYEHADVYSLNGTAPFGYYLHMQVAKSVSDLDALTSRSRRNDGYLPASFEPELLTGDSTVWAGGADIFRAAADLTKESLLKDELTRFARMFQPTGKRGRPFYAPGRIVRLRDGSIRLEHDHYDGDRVFARITGERVATTVWTDRD